MNYSKSSKTGKKPIKQRGLKAYSRYQVPPNNFGLMNRTDRLLAIILELQDRKHLRAEDLAAIFEVSKRTIYRDIQLIQELGIPVIKDKGLFKILGTYKVPSYRTNIVGELCNE